MFSPDNETAMLMDAIESLRVLRQKSRARSHCLEQFRPDDNHDVDTNAAEFKENKYDAMEHRRKIRELTIAIEAQEMDEARRLALLSQKNTARVGTSERQSNKKHEFSGAAVIDSGSSAQTNAPSYSMELSARDEQKKRIGNLTRVFDSKLNVAKQGRALPRKTNPSTAPLATQVEKLFCAGELIAPFSRREIEKESSQQKSIVSSDLLQPVKTLSTELDTLDADSVQREKAFTSSQDNGITFLVNKEDVENEDTTFGAPLSPNSLFLKYGIHASQPYRSKLCISQRVFDDAEHVYPLPQKSKLERQKTVIKNAAILSQSTKDAMRTADAKKSNRPIDVFKKMMVWDVSSSSSQEESFREGRVKNDTFDDSSCRGEERSDVSSNYSASFETEAENLQDKRNSKIQSTKQYSSSFDSEDSAAYQTSYSGSTDEKTDESTSDIEYQSSYTSTDGCDTISYVSSSTTMLGKQGFPLL